MGDKHTTLELKKELAEREGVNVEELLRRVLELYPEKPRSAAEVLELVKQVSFLICSIPSFSTQICFFHNPFYYFVQCVTRSN